MPKYSEFEVSCTNDGLIVTVSAAEQAVDAGDALSFTRYVYELVLVSETEYVLLVLPDIAVAHDAPVYHW